ncbi:MAG: hypothetical protein AB7G37_07185 [Solirubrobacteraceae bacterium]
MSTIIDLHLTIGDPLREVIHQWNASGLSPTLRDDRGTLMTVAEWLAADDVAYTVDPATGDLMERVHAKFVQTLTDAELEYCTYNEAAILLDALLNGEPDDE